MEAWLIARLDDDSYQPSMVEDADLGIFLSEEAAKAKAEQLNVARRRAGDAARQDYYQQRLARFEHEQAINASAKAHGLPRYFGWVSEPVKPKPDTTVYYEVWGPYKIDG